MTIIQLESIVCKNDNDPIKYRIIEEYDDDFEPPKLIREISREEINKNEDLDRRIAELEAALEAIKK